MIDDFIKDVQKSLDDGMFLYIDCIFGGTVCVNPEGHCGICGRNKERRNH